MEVVHRCGRISLSSGTYTLFIHDPKSGFCRLDEVVVPPSVVDVGDRALSAGATISGAIHFMRPTPVPDEVLAVGPSGVSVRRAFPEYSSFDSVELAGLWPGHWTVSARSRNEVLAIGELDVEGTATYHVTLTAGGGAKP